MTAVLLFLLAAFARVDVINESFEVPAGDWRYVARPVSREPATVDCMFEADRPDAQVRVALVTRADLDAWRAGRDHDELGATPAGPRGMLRVSLAEPEAYLVIENRGTPAARVRLHVFLEQPEVRYLSRERQLAVILISFGVFFATVSLSVRKLLKAVRR